MVLDGNPAENSQFPDALECMLKYFEDKDFENVFTTDQPGLPPEHYLAMEIDLDKGEKPVAKPAFRLVVVDLSL
jgi:hypothetical protein